jgi:hypothetical protein
MFSVDIGRHCFGFLQISAELSLDAIGFGIVGIVSVSLWMVFIFVAYIYVSLWLLYSSIVSMGYAAVVSTREIDLVMCF